MEREEAYLLDLIIAVVRRWYLIIGISVVVALCAYLVCFFLPVKFEASGMIVVAPPQFQSEFRPSLLPFSTFRRLVTSDDLLRQALNETQKKHPQYATLTLLSIKKNIRVEAEGKGGEGSVPTLIVAARHRDPQFITDFVNNWLTLFKKRAEQLAVSQAKAMEGFITSELQKAREQLQKAENALHRFDRRVSVTFLEEIKKGIETLLVDKKMRLQELIAQEKEKEEELSLTRREVEAQQINGRWLGEMDVEVKDKENDKFLKEITEDVLSVRDAYKRELDRYISFANENNLSRMEAEEKRLNERISEVDDRLSELGTLIPSAEKELALYDESLKKEPRKLKLTTSPVESAFWEALLKEKAGELSRLSLSREVLNPVYEQLLNARNDIARRLASYRSERETLLKEREELERKHKQLQALLLEAQERKCMLEGALARARLEYEVRHQQFLTLKERSRQLAVDLQRVRSQRLQAEAEIKRLQQELEQTVQALEQAKGERERLQRDLDEAQSAYEGLQQKTEQALFTKGQMLEDVRIAAFAVRPDEPVSPDRLLITAITALVAFFISTGLFTLFEAANLLKKTEQHEEVRKSPEEEKK